MHFASSSSHDTPGVCKAGSQVKMRSKVVSGSGLYVRKMTRSWMVKVVYHCMWGLA
jgi:hypothetical protein